MDNQNPELKNLNVEKAAEEAKKVISRKVNPKNAIIEIVIIVAVSLIIRYAFTDKTEIASGIGRTVLNLGIPFVLACIYEAAAYFIRKKKNSEK